MVRLAGDTLSTTLFQAAICFTTYYEFTYSADNLSSLRTLPKRNAIESDHLAPVYNLIYSTNLAKSLGRDEIHPSLLKMLASVIAQISAALFFILFF